MTKLHGKEGKSLFSWSICSLLDSQGRERRKVKPRLLLHGSKFSTYSLNDGGRGSLLAVMAGRRSMLL